MYFYGFDYLFGVFFMYFFIKIEINIGCIVFENCYFDDWIGWSVCKGFCNIQIQIRICEFCCFLDLLYRLKVICVKYCNVIGGIDEECFCWVCMYGFNLFLERCQCDSWYRGFCCDGMI